MKHVSIALACCLLALPSCSSSKPKFKTVVDEYPVAYRQSPPDPVYSRLTWSHLPQPIQPKARDNAPLLMPVVEFQLPKSNLEEAIQALAQTIGYNWSYPDGIGGRPIAINMTASVDEILAEIGRQAQVVAVLDHDQRVVRVVDRSSVFGTPAATLPGSDPATVGTPG